MGDRFDYWISGVNVQVQNPSAVHQMMRYTWGTDISQDYNKKENKRSENWFHFAIPTPIMLDGDKVDYKHAYIQGFINDHAYIKRVVISHGGANKYKRIFEGNYNITGKDFKQDFDLPDERCTRSITISVRVEFEDGGRVVFGGAGVHFMEHY